MRWGVGKGGDECRAEGNMSKQCKKACKNKKTSTCTGTPVTQPPSARESELRQLFIERLAIRFIIERGADSSGRGALFRRLKVERCVWYEKRKRG